MLNVGRKDLEAFFDCSKHNSFYALLNWHYEVSNEYKKTINYILLVEIFKNFNKEGSKCNHTHILGVAQSKPLPYCQRWKYDNLV